MSWLTKLLPPKINREQGASRRANLPEGLWSKCPGCAAVLYSTDLEKNAQVCPKCGHHHRIAARPRIDLLLDEEGRTEFGASIMRVDSLKSNDSKRYSDRLNDATKITGETDSLVVMQGCIKKIPAVVAAFEFEFMGGSMGSVLGERFVRGVQAALDNNAAFICVAASGGARMQEGLFSLMQMAKTTAALTRLSQKGLPFISNYFVLGFDSNGCATPSATFGFYTGINNYTYNSNDVILTPINGGDYFSLLINSKEKIKQLSLIDVAGKQINLLSYDTDGENNFILDLNNVSKGIYFVKVEFVNHSSIRRLVKL